MLRLGVIQYLNSLPLVYALQQGVIPLEAEISAGIPSSLNHKLRVGELDAAYISTAEYLAHSAEYARLANLCIGAHEEVLSVCLFAKLPIQNLNGRAIALTGSSATSRLLLQILCHHFWHIRPVFKELDQNETSDDWDGVLLIGDQCLHYLGTHNYYCTDLAQAWYQYTGLPFVFGLPAVRREVLESNPKKTQKLAQNLYESFEWAQQRQEQIVDFAHSQSRLPKKLLRHYYNSLRFRLDESMNRGLNKFSQLSAELATHI